MELIPERTLKEIIMKRVSFLGNGLSWIEIDAAEETEHRHNIVRRDIKSGCITRTERLMWYEMPGIPELRDLVCERRAVRLPGTLDGACRQHRVRPGHLREAGDQCGGSGRVL